jgi:hypothetical protein
MDLATRNVDKPTPPILCLRHQASLLFIRRTMEKLPTPFWPLIFARFHGCFIPRGLKLRLFPLGGIPLEEKLLSGIRRGWLWPLGYSALKEPRGGLHCIITWPRDSLKKETASHLQK